MQTFTKLFLIAGLCATYVAADTTILFCNQDNCQGSCSSQTVAADGACHELGGIKSAETTSLDSGASVTVYSDSTCSVGAFTAGLNSCVFSETGWNSYSVDA